MKKIFLLIILQIALFAGFAQKHEPLTMQSHLHVNPVKDKQEFQGYTIRLMPALHVAQRMGSYSFDILKDNKPVMHEVRNPLLFSPKGIQKKEDVYKIAQWMITEYINTGHWRNTMPPHIARQLKIETR